MKYPYLVAALLIVFGIIDIALLGNQYELTKSDWPGWVQAIGSIAALGVAIFVMSRQNRYALDADKRALLRRANAVSAILDRANAQIPQLCRAIAEGIMNGNQGRLISAMTAAKIKLAETQSTVRAIPGHELGSYELVVGLHMTLEVASTFETTLGVWLQAPPLPPANMIAEFMELMSEGSKAATEMHTKGMEMLKAL